jgi:predicted transcriptional regulator
MERYTWNINLRNDLRQPVREIAFHRNKPQNHIVSEVLSEYLKKKSKKDEVTA